MKAGRELDALVAEKVMSWKWITVLNTSILLPPSLYERKIGHWGVRDGAYGDKREWLDGIWFSDSRRDPPERWPYIEEYTTDIAAAWQVINNWNNLGWHWEIASGKNAIHVTVLTDADENFAHSGRATTPELAICLAALKAVGVGPEAGEGEE